MTKNIANKKVGAAAKRVGTPVVPMTTQDKGYARAAVRLKVSRAVWTLWDQLRREQGVDQTWLVDRLGSNKGRVSRLLNGSGNWTLDTVADLLEAMEGRITAVEVKRYRDIGVASGVAPSLSGVRDHPGLWNVIVIDHGDVDGGEPALLEDFGTTSPSLRSVRPRIVSSEPA